MAFLLALKSRVCGLKFGTCGLGFRVLGLGLAFQKVRTHLELHQRKCRAVPHGADALKHGKLAHAQSPKGEGTLGLENRAYSLGR